MLKLAIIGAGDLGQQIAHHAEQYCGMEVVGFYDDTKEKGTEIKGYAVLGKIADLESDFSLKVFDKLMVGIGYRHMGFRKAVFERFYAKIPFANVIHPTAYIDKTCTLGTGLFILPGCMLDFKVVLEDNIMLNIGSCIAHDSVVKSHTFISPRVSVAGFTTIGTSCILGISTTVIDNIQIKDHIQTGAGAVVIDNLEIPGLYVGVPAKLKKQRNDTL